MKHHYDVIKAALLNLDCVCSSAPGKGACCRCAAVESVTKLQDMLDDAITMANLNGSALNSIMKGGSVVESTRR